MFYLKNCDIQQPYGLTHARNTSFYSNSFTGSCGVTSSNEITINMCICGYNIHVANANLTTVGIPLQLLQILTKMDFQCTTTAKKEMSLPVFHTIRDSGTSYSKTDLGNCCILLAANTINLDTLQFT